MKKNICTIYLTRHGETSWNKKGLIQGHTDVPLNATGELQAKELGAKLKNISFDDVYSSDLIRARRTAEIITLEKKLAIVTSKALRERSFGKYEGKHFSFINNEKAWKLLSQYKKSSKNFDNQIESDESLIGRYFTFIREVAVASPGKTVLIVSHGGVMRWLLIHLGYGDEKTIPPGSIDNLAYVKIESDGVDFFIKETSGITKKVLQ